MAKEFKEPKKKESSGVSAAFWLVCALILLILFLVNRERMLTVLQNTGFFGKVFGNDPEFVVNHTSSRQNEPMAEIEIGEQPFVYDTQTQADAGQGDGKSQTKTETEKKRGITVVPKTDEEKPDDSASAAGKAPASAPQQPEKKADTAVTTADTKANTKADTSVASNTPASTAQMDQHLCFIQIAGDGALIRKEVNRSIPKTNMPLTAAINALLKGPNLSELENGCMSLIPEGTKLLGASVSNGVATINFSDEFRYNQYGVEGYYGQLMQVVYTAAAFGNIESVLFLIEGEKTDYLGSEGVFIGAPLPKSTFR